jgi:hypothetical protein
MSSKRSFFAKNLAKYIINHNIDPGNEDNLVVFMQGISLFLQKTEKQSKRINLKIKTD